MTTRAPQLRRPRSVDSVLATTTAGDQKGRRKVVHLFWTRQLEAAQGIATDAKQPVPLRTMCGVVSLIKPGLRDPGLVETIGGYFPLYEVDDCRNCARVYSSHLRRTHGGTTR